MKTSDQETKHCTYSPITSRRMNISLGGTWSTGMKEHIYFLQRIGSYFLKVKGLDINEYIKLMTNTGQPLDEIAVVIIACMYHIHISVLMDGQYWTSKRDHALADCKILIS